jgi:hypothetical protein
MHMGTLAATRAAGHIGVCYFGTGYATLVSGHGYDAV